MSKVASFLPVKELIFPGVITTIFVGRDKSINALDRAILENNKLLLFLQRDADESDPDIPGGLHRVGVLVNVVQSTKLPDNLVRVLLEAEERVKLIDIVDDQNYVAQYEVMDIVEKNSAEEQAIKRKILDAFEEYLRVTNKISPELVMSIRSINSVNKLVDLISSNLNITLERRQNILETTATLERAYKILGFISEELDMIDLEKNIDSKVRDQMSSMQRNYYLKAKIQAIKDELGEEASYIEETDEVKMLIEEANIPEKIKDRLYNEANKLAKMPHYSSEFSVIRNYIDTTLELPWKKSTKDVLNINKASKILEDQHYGLKEVKERILEFLAVKQLNKKVSGSVLCLAGPPGVGKTSLARSIAEALGRRFARVSLGGIKEEAEIRGHRRTYVGAMPGRIIKEIKHVNSNNPLMLLDEIDKMPNDFRGDPAAALLEVLDPEQNSEFIDHYLNLPFDLSKVFFIATANDINSIPHALKDRLEVINISSYTEQEKLHIAKKYLVKKSQEQHGLKKKKIKINDAAILAIIDGYTREAGVRNLKRAFDKVFRKIAKKSIEKKVEQVNISPRNLSKYLGKRRFIKEDDAKKDLKIGIVNGLAYTSVGGCVMKVESVTTPGKGKLISTGALGDVMKESTQVAFSYVQSISDKLGIKPDRFAKENLHIHFPEGGTPKDGPSAGIAITSSIISTLTKKGVRQDIAMTGEVSMNGDVMPIGGLKEKIMGAHRIGIREVIVPKKNESSLDDLSKEIRKDMKIHLAEKYLEDVYNLVIKA